MPRLPSPAAENQRCRPHCGQLSWGRVHFSIEPGHAQATWSCTWEPEMPPSLRAAVLGQGGLLQQSQGMPRLPSPTAGNQRCHPYCWQLSQGRVGCSQVSQDSTAEASHSARGLPLTCSPAGPKLSEKEKKLTGVRSPYYLTFKRL